jgi:uracil-DNA glycosylase
MTPSTTPRTPNMEPSWMSVLGDAFDQTYMHDLRAFLAEEKRLHTVYPPGNEIFQAFWLTPFDKVRVVILGQDPYIGPGQAHGLCFSVRPDVRPPPSLVNVFKEIERDLGIPPPDHGCLVSWARQGVLLLNSVLTVRAGTPLSHAHHGWETFTDRVILELNRRREGLVFALWGGPAAAKAEVVDRSRHLVLKATHPSPKSVWGYTGCDHFSKINGYFAARGEPPIQWALPPRHTPLD